MFPLHLLNLQTLCIQVYIMLSYFRKKEIKSSKHEDKQREKEREWKHLKADKTPGMFLVFII